MKKLNENSEKDKLEELFITYYQNLRAYAFRYVGNPDAADDIVQDVFFQLWEKRSLLFQIKSIRSYLFTSVYNRSLNYLKHQQVRNDSHGNHRSARSELEDFYHSRIQGSSESLLTRELEQKITECIAAMPEQCHRVFILSRKYGMKNTEISTFLGINLKTVEKHMSKALSLLRVYLKEYLPVLSLLLVKIFTSQG